VRYLLEFLQVFETLTLIQTRTIEQFPVLLLRNDFRARMTESFEKSLLVEETIDPDDVGLFRITDSPREAVALIPSIEPADGDPDEGRCGSSG
jgi:predicted Rossmann-fold nucleotide-binding protein